MGTLTLTLTAEQCRTVRRALSHYASHIVRAAGDAEAEADAAGDDWNRERMLALAEAQRANAFAADVLWTTFAAVKD